VRLSIPALHAIACLLALSRTLHAQAGDHAGEAQPALRADLIAPPAPALSPDAERATFRLPRGLAIELVAAEPLVRDPVQAVFDAAGRLWVVEMCGYMPDVDGHGEREPKGAIAVLADEDGDGVFEKRTVFLDGLVLPRGVAPTRGGALVLAPPELLFCTDEDGDGRADKREVVARGLEGIASPEHAINGLLPTLDNAFQCAKSPLRFVFRDGRFASERIASSGQWGLAQDDVGRVWTNSNSDPLRVDLFPASELARNANLGVAAGAYVQVARDLSVRSARVNTGVNRGYQAETLRADGRLANVTAACAPWILRSGGLGDAYRGNAFVCEPAANLVLRYEIAADEHGVLRAAPAPREDGLDFLTSTDERFRPVGLTEGPDGALYVADMYRGVIQHRMFVTSFLRSQVLARGLEQPIGRGRIWRVVREGHVRAKPRAPLARASWSELAAALESPDGWIRDRAQQRFVEEGESDSDAIAAVRLVLAESRAPLARLHALWALAGLGFVDEKQALRALADSDPRVRLAAIRASEAACARSRTAILPRWLAIARADGTGARRQVLLSLGEVRTPDAVAAMLELLHEDASTNELRTAAVSGLAGRELEVLLLVSSPEGWVEDVPGRAALFTLLARSVIREGRGDRIETMLAALGSLPEQRSWQAAAILTGTLEDRRRTPGDASGAIRLAAAPASLAGLRSCAEKKGFEALDELLSALDWPGRPGSAAVRELDPKEHARFVRGRELYAQSCVACHLDSGQGESGRAPPLRRSPWVLGQDARLARILLHGLQGPLEIGGEIFDGEMPVLAADDETIAAVLTYVRREWGHSAEPVTPETIARVREAEQQRGRPWTAVELAKIP
jgi:mono/diheme cytochrome c family protein/glucose/arabinose dehydrogenase